MKVKEKSLAEKLWATFGALVLMVCAQLLWTGAAVAQAPAGCPYVCDGTYALCISATCDDEGNCGQGDTTGSGGGYCYVFEGESCSYYGPCQTSGLTSTYSKHLLETYGFHEQRCEDLPGNSDCMGEACTLTGEEVPLKNVNTGETDMISTAICSCTTPKAGHGTFQVLNSNSENCSVTWSTF